MDIWKRIEWERDDLLPHLIDEGVLSMEMTEEGYIEHAMAEDAYIERCTREAHMHETISESLGNGNVVEIDPATGAFTLHDSEYGVTLSAAQVLVLESFLSSCQEPYPARDGCVNC